MNNYSNSFSNYGGNQQNGGYNAYGGGYGNNMSGGNNVGSDYNQGGFSSNDDPKKEYSQQTLRPVTIKQLIDTNIDHPDKPLVIDGEEVKQVVIIGVVRNINAQTTMTQYTIEDGTGSIEVKMWVSQNQALDEEDNDVPLSSYAKVIGDFRLFNDKKHILAHSIKPITDFNEITHHGLETILAHLQKTKGKKSILGAYDSSKIQSGNGIVPGQYKGNEGNVIKRVYDYISSINNKLEGIHISAIEKELAPGISSAEIRKATNILVDDGNIYTVIDENHFLSTHAELPNY
ncbi:hypothetical protein BB559_001751 [Furculomyces boomerangus]|uniref:Replication protein A C-terminal domain-containing protein n=2 Tax=Harpellales TaxID=61421 RepID=A0A2T9Z0N7_9FUNG|nr:hypothetical protein BB559_001751 [Furculomyces boomerangus]PWA00828.1 hypothetical protein BB558_003107 [Smittium angustum]